MAKKYYAVRKGHKTGVFTSTKEYLRATRGFGSCEAKGFSTIEEALEFLTPAQRLKVTEGGHAVKLPEPAGKKKKTHVIREYPAAFTDGSYRKGRHGYGVVVVEYAPDGLLRTVELCGQDKKPSFAPSKNVAAELLAVVKAVEYAVWRRYPRLAVHHDLAQAAQWAQEPGTCSVSRWYHAQLRRMAHGMQLSFVKVAAHSGIEQNTRADQLAALGVDGVIKTEFFSPVMKPSAQRLTHVRGEALSNLSARVTPQVHELLRQWAKANGITMRDAIELLILAGVRDGMDT